MATPAFPQLKTGTWTPARRALWVDQAFLQIRGHSDWEKHPEEGPALRQRQRLLLDWSEARTPEAIAAVFQAAKTHGVTPTVLAEKALFLERFDLLDSVRVLVGESWESWEVNTDESFAGLCHISLDMAELEKNHDWEISSMLSESRKFSRELEKEPRWVDRMCKAGVLVDALIAQGQWNWKALAGPDSRLLRLVTDDIILKFHEAATPADHTFLDHQLEEYTARMARTVGHRPWVHGKESAEAASRLEEIVDRLFSLGANPDVLRTRRVRDDRDDKDSPLVPREVTSSFHLAVVYLALGEIRPPYADPGESGLVLAIRPEVVRTWLDRCHPENTPPSTELFYRILELVTPVGMGNAGRELIERFSALPDAPGVRSRMGQFFRAASVFGRDWVMTSAGCDHVPPLRPSLADFIEEAHHTWPDQLRAHREHARNPRKRREAESEERINRVPQKDRASSARWYGHEGLLIGGAPLEMMGHFLEIEDEKKAWDTVLPMVTKACHDVSVVDDHEVEETINAFLGQFSLHVVLVDSPGRPVQGPLRRL
jgi:hypothetical protein